MKLTLRHRRTAKLTAVVLWFVAISTPAGAVEKSDPSCGKRSKDPGGYDFCMSQTGKAPNNPVAAAQPASPPVIGGRVPPKPGGDPGVRQCTDNMVSKQHMSRADAAVYCTRNL